MGANGRQRRRRLGGGLGRSAETRQDAHEALQQVGIGQNTHGAPILDDCSGGWFVGRIVERVPLGDHHGMVLEPVTVGAIPDADRRPLRFGAVRRIEPGHPA